MHGRTLNPKVLPEGFGKDEMSMRNVVKSAKKVYRSLLLKKREEILASTRSEPEALSANVQSPDAVEFAVRTVEQDVTVVTANRRSSTLKEIERALARCAGGTY